jgi:hypothetical protein
MAYIIHAVKVVEAHISLRPQVKHIRDYDICQIFFSKNSLHR